MKVAKRARLWHALASVPPSERTEAGHGTSPEDSPAAAGRGRADRPRADRPRQQRARRSRGAGEGAAGGSRRPVVHRGGPGRRAPVGRRGGPPGGPLQYRRAGGAAAAPWRWPADGVRRGHPRPDPAGVPAPAGPGGGRHRHLVAHHAAARAARGAGRAAPGEHQDHPVRALGRRVHLAAEPHLVPDRDGRAPAQGGAGHGHRPGRRPQKELIERAYTLGEQLGLAVWCQEEAGPYQAIPHPGPSWQPVGRPAREPHEYVRGGTAKLLTLFRPATGEVRARPVATATNAVLHPWLKGELAAILAALPAPASAAVTPETTRACWESWQAGLTERFT